MFRAEQLQTKLPDRELGGRVEASGRNASRSDIRCEHLLRNRRAESRSRQVILRFETYTADADLAPLFRGLPEDHCQCPHWGYVITGKVTFTFTDGREETYEGGDAYYAPPGHLPRLYAGSEVVEFHPTAELAKTMEVVERNMEAMSS